MSLHYRSIEIAETNIEYSKLCYWTVQNDEQSFSSYDCSSYSSNPDSYTQAHFQEPVQVDNSGYTVSDFANQLEK